MKKLNLFLALLLSLTFVSCYKQGCTDPKALNYNSEVKQSDFSCEYQASAAFWMTIEKRDALILAGHEMMYFEIEGEILDSMATSSFGTASGDCNAAGSKTFTKNFLGHTEKSFIYRVRGLDQAVLQKGFITFDTDDCNTIEVE